MVNLKTGVTRKQSAPDFLKKHSLPPITHTYSESLMWMGSLTGWFYIGNI